MNRKFVRQNFEMKSKSRSNLIKYKSKLDTYNLEKKSENVLTLKNDDFDRRSILRRKATEEILSSERTYIDTLNKLINFFVLPLKNLNLIDAASYTNLFGQIELIYSINKEFLNRLETNHNDVATVFLKMSPFFKIYSVYAFDFKNCMVLLQTLITENAPFRAFLETNESRPEVQQKLNSLMITPIQRVPRYRLLLQQVLLFSSPADTEYKSIQDSIMQIESTINHINSVVEDQENISRLINIQNSLNSRKPNIMKSVSRKLVKEGILLKYNANGAIVKRYCVLCSDIFMYCKILKVGK
jgi:RhoGEF domain